MKFWLAVMSKKLIDKFHTVYLARLLHTVVFPVLMGFSMDLPLFKQSAVACAFGLATLLVDDFIDALITLWQAFAISGFVILVISYFIGTYFAASSGALLIPVVWVFMLISRHRFPSLVSDFKCHDTSALIVALIILIVFVLQVPRNLQDSFGFLSAEDNAAWLQVIKETASNDRLLLISNFDFASVQYFVKFVLNFFIQLEMASLPTTNISSGSLRSVSNGWVFMFVSSIFFVLRASTMLLKQVRSNFGTFTLLGAVGFQVLLHFRASHVFGHLSQYLANCTVLLFVLQIIEFKLEKRRVAKIISGVLGTIFAISIVGSYNPWLPVSLVCILLVLNSFPSDSFTRRLFKSKYRKIFFAMSAALGPIILRFALDQASGLDDGGSVNQIPLEGVWIAIGIAVLIAFNLLPERLSRKTSFRNLDPNAIVFGIRTYLVFISFSLGLGLLLGFSLNQYITLSFVCAVALIFSRHGVSLLHTNFRSFARNVEFDVLFLLALTSFLYALIIFLLSRFVGPVFEPRYAANKSMFMVFGQFMWLILILVSIDRFYSRKILSVLRTLVVCVCLFVVSGIGPFLRYNTIQSKWWHKPVLEALSENPDAVIVCISPDWRSVDYDVYTCNRFLQSMTRYVYPASGFRYLAWYQPDEFEKISGWFDGNSGREQDYTSDTQVIVISRAEPSLETKTIFDSVSSKMIRFITTS